MLSEIGCGWRKLFFLPQTWCIRSHMCMDGKLYVYAGHGCLTSGRKWGCSTRRDGVNGLVAQLWGSVVGKCWDWDGKGIARLLDCWVERREGKGAVTEKAQRKLQESTKEMEKVHASMIIKYLASQAVGALPALHSYTEWLAIKLGYHPPPLPPYPFSIFLFEKTYIEEAHSSPPLLVSSPLDFLKAIYPCWFHSTSHFPFPSINLNSAWFLW